MVGLSRHGTAKTISGIILCGLLLGAFAVFNSVALSGPAEICVPISQNPVFGPASGNVWDNQDIATSFVLYNGTAYLMWYTSYSDTGSNVSGIGFATSPDGINWIRYPSPVLMHGTGGWDSGNVFEPDVIWNGTSYMMYYSATNVTSIDSSIGLATSADGVHWQKYVGNPILTPGPSMYDQSWVKYASVIFDGVSYRMWYSGRSSSTTGLYPRVIGFASSSDGMHWTKYAGNPVLVENGTDNAGIPVVQHPSVVQWTGGYLMAMSQDGHSLLYATSKDGLAWGKGQVPLINNTNERLFGMEMDDDYPFLLNGPSGLLLYYTQFNSSLAGQPIPIRTEMANCPNSLLPFFLQTTTTTETITRLSTQTSLTTATSTVVATATETLSNTSTITTVQTESYLSPVDVGLIAAGVFVLALAVVILSKTRLLRGR
jgi:predicted GH43/DUF377 family glycosyl hydrolase